jgi:cytochrome d ubiquinol oxidase subunit II
MSILLDYECLRLLWWGLLGFLLMGFAVMDGFDLGVAALLPIIAKTDVERRIVINTVGPFWEGNQVWLILGAGAIFAAWPAIYAVAFSSFYLAMVLILVGLILRPVGFKYRSKVKAPHWRSTWDICLCIGGVVPAVLFGVVVGNVLLGIPFTFDASLRIFYHGTFTALLSPFALLCGLLSLVMCMRHGALYLSFKVEGAPLDRLRRLLPWLTLGLLGLLTLVGVWGVYKLKSYQLVPPVVREGPSNPLLKTVQVIEGAWLHNFQQIPLFLSAPCLAYGGILFSSLFSYYRKDGWSFFCNCLSIIGIIATVGFSLFPILLPSTSNPFHSLTVWDASSSRLTLFIMLLATVIFMPMVLAYTAWAYRVLRGKVTAEDVQSKTEELY